MKKRYISIGLVITLLVLIFNNIGVSAVDISEEGINDPLKLYRYDANKKTVTEISNQDIKDRLAQLEQISINNIADGKLCDEEYVPYGLESVPPNAETRALLGSWSEINPATGGQYRNTVYVEYIKNGNRARASGFLIGPSTVATAGHVIYSGGKFAVDIVVIPARAGSSYPYGTAGYNGAVVSSGWYDNEDGNYDWGIIELDSNLGDSVGWLGLETKTTSYNGKSVMSNGYPKTVNGTTKHTMYRTNGTVSSSQTYKLYSQNTNAAGGMSGGPLYYYSSSTGYTAIGISTTGGSNSNGYIRITRELYDIFLSYRNVRV